MNPGVRRAAAIALTGLDGTAIMVEAAVSEQLPGMAIIGLPDAALAEAKQRVRTASAQVGLPIANRFVTVNLAPASLPKHGSGFDLAIALAVLAASGRVPEPKLADTAHIGELGLDGSLRRPTGLLSAVIAARELGFTRVLVPAESAPEARLVPGITVVSSGSLLGAIAWHIGRPGDWSEEAGPTHHSARAPRTTSAAPHNAAADMRDVLGQPEAVEAMVIAATGRHHVSMLGPPGSGKTLLAARLPTILPELSPREALVASSIASLSGTAVSSLVTQPPFESPHHTASAAAIIGSGDSRGVRPGALSRASYGVLFLDEAPEFGRAVLDDLREPLESRTITISRARFQATLPAHVQLVLASNPCPCGNAGSPETALDCTCSPQTRVRYLSRLSGPLTDRIDVRLNVRRVSSVLAARSAPDQASSSSRALRERVSAARDRSRARLADTPWQLNGEIPGAALRGSEFRLQSAATAAIDQALARGALTLRGYDRTLRVAWSIADLAGVDRPGRREVAQALALRGGAA